MRTRLRHLWEVVTTGYWFVPTVMMLAAAGAAFLLLYIDRATIGARVGWLYAGGADGAKTMLSTVAGSVITVAGVVFSITIAALTQASSQFGPRLLRNFMRDTGNQVVLGTFVGTFIYCLLVLRTIHGKMEDGVEFVPQASVTFAVLLATASIAVLIYFIHHVSVSLQAPAVVAAVLQDMNDVIARLPVDQKGTGEPLAASDELPPEFHASTCPVPSVKQGYVQAVDYAGLVEFARGSDLILRVAYRPGQYVIEGTPLVHAWPADRGGNKEVAEHVNAAFICGRNATTEQDVEQALRQMVEVAVRALSPGINDPFTAINCVDALGSAICGVARRGLPGPHRYDGQGKLRLVAPVSTFAGVVDTAFNQIRQYGRGSVAVTIRLLEVLAICGRQVVNEDQRGCLLRHATMVYEDSREAVTQPLDRDDVRARWEVAVRVLRVHPEADVGQSFSSEQCVT
jgi:uncharacterized membrane protein